MAQPAPDPAIVRRWLTAIGLGASAGDLIARASTVEAAAALVAADAASETALGILADLSGVASQVRDPHENVLQRALATAKKARTPLSPELVRRVRNGHTARNSVVHHGQEASPRLVEEAVAGADGVLDALERVLPRLKAIPQRTGVATAVASLIDAPEVADELRASERFAAAGETHQALRAAAIAHYLILRRVDPPLRARRDPLSALRRLDRGLDDAFGDQRRRVAVLEAWLVPLALGTSPSEYSRLVQTIGSAQPMRGDWFHRYRDEGNRLENGERDLPDRTREQARWAVGELARIVFRLWEIRSLWEGDLETLYRRPGHR